MAELGNDWKRSNSHRARAAQPLGRVTVTALFGALGQPGRLLLVGAAALCVARSAS